MFVAFVTLLILLSVPLTGGRLTALAKVRIQGRWLVAAALVVQVAITSVFESWPHALLVGLHIGSYALIAVALWQNRRLPGLKLIAAGGLLNGLVITLNGGTLPASARALAEAGMVTNGDFTNSGVLPHPILAPFGDIFATPAWLPFRNVISIGDCIALIGVAVLVHAVCDSRLKSLAAATMAMVQRCLRRSWLRVEERSPGA
jgi:Family of unknown function (DUF5317)